jgi:hypothetical protein
MNNSIHLLERVRATTPNKSKGQTAMILGIERANLSRMYRGEGYPNGLHCAEIAKITGIPLQDVITYVAEDKAKSDATKQLVRQRLPRLLPTTGLALACIVGGQLLLGMERAQAGELAQNGTHEVRIIDIMTNSYGPGWRGAFGRL